MSSLPYPKLSLPCKPRSRCAIVSSRLIKKSCGCRSDPSRRRQFGGAMQEAETVALLRETMLVVLKLAGPPLLVALCVGLIVSLLQAVTQINEASLAFVPKVIAVAGVLLLLGP